MTKCHIPKDQEWRLTNKNVYYTEYRTNDDSNVKIYHQTKTVNYADYKIGKYYISPFDLLSVQTGAWIITPIHKKVFVPVSIVEI